MSMDFLKFTIYCQIVFPIFLKGIYNSHFYQYYKRVLFPPASQQWVLMGINVLYIYMCVCTYIHICMYLSVQFSCSVVSDSLQPHELQHARPPCPSPNPRVYSNPCPLSRWCHPTVSSSVVPFSSHFQSFPALGSFQMSQFFASDGQRIAVSASASVLPMNIQDWFPLGWTGWISLQSKGLSRVFSNTTFQKHQFFSTQLLYSLTLTSILTTGKIIALTRWTFVGKVMFLLFNILSRLVIAFLPKNERLLIS